LGIESVHSLSRQNQRPLVPSRKVGAAFRFRERAHARFVLLTAGSDFGAFGAFQWLRFPVTHLCRDSKGETRHSLKPGATDG
jgi:hypothetical protein